MLAWIFYILWRNDKRRLFLFNAAEVHFKAPSLLKKNVDEVLEVEAVQHVSEINYCVWNTFELQLTAELLLIKIVMPNYSV